MPPHKKVASKRKITEADSACEVEVKKVKQSSSTDEEIKEKNSDQVLIECETSSDDFVQWMAQTVKKLKDEDSLRRLFSDETNLKQKELSINIVKHLKQVTDEFLVSVMQADMFMTSNSIRTINPSQDSYFLFKLDIPEIWAIIFSYLPVKEFVQINRVCKLWKQASELPQALVHYEYPIDVKSEMIFFEKYITFRIDAIKTYTRIPGIENMVNKHNIKAKAIPLDHSKNAAPEKDDISAYCTIFERTDTVFDKLKSLSCHSSPFILNVFSKASSALKQFPTLTHLCITSHHKKTKEITISHPTITSLHISDFSNIVIQCPTLEKCTVFRSENLSIDSKQLSSLGLNDIAVLNVKEPTMAWDLIDLEHVTVIVKLDCPFVKRAYVNHDSMIKYVPNLVSMIVNGESIGYDCLKKLPSTNQCLKEITCKNFKKNEGLPDKKILDQVLKVVEYVTLEDCSPDFVATILNSLSECVRGITFTKINLSKTLLDILDPSTFPNLHILKINNFTKTSLKSAQVEKMLKRMKSINNLALQAAKNTSIEMNIPDHVEELELRSVQLVGIIDSKKLFMIDVPNSGVFSNVEYLCLKTFFWRSNDLNLPSLKKLMPSLKYLETYSNCEDSENTIEFIRKEKPKK
ncbi:Hypothetical protein NAEGRDRAFT_71600 [Naegleria gruberi]|uniref:F-box domain-containing protein n=1 Tax=Naegleria gruberi TaxID=5762 RepID=D2VRI9_NAEGR|nr:uncharacterized protein NAEGRDRAFT_71600 [Naegleria gruberi]EFC40684.1 Hypothetical protein NAEGRDRAFT_71600 [Naegleria gruberi]|eukprot:XP_002673428.1 Hypothetical protein NAEGRDRAFT_71600 [Naegleria gruberi strain NEG-M]